MLRHLKKYKWRYFAVPGFVFVIWFWFCLPSPLFSDPTCTVLEDRRGRLLSARIAGDGQWRFPAAAHLPEKFVEAVTCFEDEYFFYHPGVNPVSLTRALWQNVRAGKVVSGGSTISMQTIRLSRRGRHRTLREKCIEILQAMRLELSLSKDEILNLYAAHAPFGGNVVGLDAAAWRYFGRSPQLLSWGEVATLAVLPNAPSLIYPGKNQLKLKQKRDRLIDKLYAKNVIDAETCELAKAEPLPGTPHHLPAMAPHLLNRQIGDGHSGERIRTTVDADLQEQVNRIVAGYHGGLSQNEIHNVAALVIDVQKGTVLAYVGNTDCPDEGSGRDVDVIMAPRSTGSIMKPFLYAFMLQDGALMPDMLVSDVPTQIAGYSPKNFEGTFDGMVPAGEALARSLNIPAVRMLQAYGLDRFHHNLRKLGLRTINKPASHYGLSVILGGAEASLWDLSNAYMNMARRLEAETGLLAAGYVLRDSLSEHTGKTAADAFQPGALWLTFNALSQLNRPLQETGWQEFQSSQKIAWKTGTSFGHRDAWAIGVTPRYLVGVWVGNADGEGRPGLTGVSVAAPVMFRIFKALPESRWFHKPQWDLHKAEVCKESGYLASAACKNILKIDVPRKGLETPLCPFHQLIHLDKTGQFRVAASCYPVHQMKTASWFLLPPVEESYYRTRNPFYRPLPPYLNGCRSVRLKNMDVIYPREFTRVYVPREIGGGRGKAVFEVAHRTPGSVIYWHLDSTFMGNTIDNHQMEIVCGPGRHRMTLVDGSGENLTWEFEVLEKS